MELYDQTSFECSKIVTLRYSTSFSMGIRCFAKKYRMPIYGIYGFVRFADEIVDSFHSYPQKELLAKFKQDTWEAIQMRISTNPILHAFQSVVNEYQIDHALIKAFLHSMEMDLYHQTYSGTGITNYIYGSAEVVGLMCLRVFYKNDDPAYQSLIAPARKLGEAFQKVNFLRDLRYDYQELGRVYFPGVDFSHFSETDKLRILNDIKHDFIEAYDGVKALHRDVRLGVYLAYRYYLALLEQIENTTVQSLMQKRHRVSDWQKVWLLGEALLKFKFKLAA